MQAAGSRSECGLVMRLMRLSNGRWLQVYVVGEVGIQEELDLKGIAHCGGPADADKKIELKPGFALHHDEDVRLLPLLARLCSAPSPPTVTPPAQADGFQPAHISCNLEGCWSAIWPPLIYIVPRHQMGRHHVLIEGQSATTSHGMKAYNGNIRIMQARQHVFLDAYTPAGLPSTGLCTVAQVGAVVVGFDRAINYYKIQYATLCISENPGCHFIATNLDAKTHLTDAQEWAGNGSMVGAIKGAQ